MENDAELESAKKALRLQGRKHVEDLGDPWAPARNLVAVRLVHPLILPHLRGADPQTFRAGGRCKLEVAADIVTIRDGARSYEVPRCMCILEWETPEPAK